jgi:hypothetical protein
MGKVVSRQGVTRKRCRRIVTGGQRRRGTKTPRRETLVRTTTTKL